MYDLLCETFSQIFEVKSLSFDYFLLIQDLVSETAKDFVDRNFHERFTNIYEKLIK